MKNKNISINVYIVPNRGRDVLPFLFVMQRVRSAGYEYVLKLHSKKSVHRKDGSDWFRDILNTLLPNVRGTESILHTLEDDNTGIIGPEGHLVSLARHIGGNKEILENLIRRIFDEKLSNDVISSLQKYVFFGGTMFWCRVDSIGPILDLYLAPDDFQSEHGQIDGTSAHAIERLFSLVCVIRGLKLYEVSSAGINDVTGKKIIKKYRFAN
jgi:lipopolysaccharide biosynthesis protein